MGKNRSLLLSLIIILIFIPRITALQVELSNQPEHGKEYIFLDQASVIIHFKCRAIISSSENLDSIRLFTNITGTFQQTGEPRFNPGNNTLLDFAVTNIPSGTYEWSCKANGLLFASEPKQFSIYIEPNNPPILKNPVPDQAWDQGTTLANSFDLDDFFQDPDNDTLAYSYTGLSSNLKLSINILNQVTFSQIEGWFGDGGTVIFTASDSELQTQSNPVKLTVRQIQNKPPQIKQPIPDQIKESDIDTWNLDLSAYLTDDRDQLTQLAVTLTDLNTSLVTTTITNQIIAFKHVLSKYGSDVITVVVKDTGNLIATQNLTVTIKEPQLIQPQNQSTPQNTTVTQNQTTQIEAVIPLIRSSTPAEQVVNLKILEEKKFTVTPSDKILKIKWYLNGKRVSDTTEYIFKPTTDGEHNLTVVVTNGLDSVVKEWQLIIKSPASETKKPEQKCGNTQVDEGETCSSCPSDIICDEGQICQDNECLTPQQPLTTITGNILGIIPTLKNNWYYPIGFLLLVIILIVIVKIANKKKSKDFIVTTFHKKEPFLKRIQRRLREIDQKKQEKKRNKSLEKLSIKKEQKDIDLIAPSTTQITHFIRESTSKGYTKRVIKKALRKHGWNRKQIRQGFKSINS